MDGNGRWAEEHDLPRADGHRAGAETIEKIVEACHGRGIEYLTLYAFSTENWLRPGEEVSSLMRLLQYFLAKKRDDMVKNGIRFVTIGDTARLPQNVQEEMRVTKNATAGGKKMTLVVALSYGSRQEILRAVNSLLAKKVENVTSEEFENELYTAGIPDPDLLIRTSNEYRISNFLLWQMAYTELYITDTLWPDFDEKELDRAMESYSRRERRFGMTSEQVREAK